MKKRIFSLFLTVLFLLPLLSFIPVRAEATVYNLRIANTDVTSENASDILGDGVFSYNNSTKTLYVRGNCTCSYNIIQNRIDGLTLYVEKDCRFNSDKYISIYLERDMTITGPGKLQIVSPCQYSILTRTGAVLTLDNAWVEISNSKYAIFGDQASEELVINNSYVHLDSDYGIALWGKITFSGGATITDPAGCYIYEGENWAVVDKNKNVTGKLTIDTDYDIIVAGKAVKMSNKSDILGNGVFSFDSVNKILTVNGNCDSPNDTVIANKLPGLTIYVAKNSTLSATSASIAISADTTITGPGKLTASSGIFVPVLAELTIENATVEATGYYGIMGANKGILTVKNSDVYAKGTGMPAICNMSAVNLSDCRITLPDGGNISGGKIVDKEGDGAYEVKIENYEQKYNVWVAGQQVTAKNKGDVLGDGTVRFYDKDQYVPLAVDMYYGYTYSNFKNSRVLVLDNLNMTKDAYHSDGGDKAQIYIDEDIFVVLIGKNTLYNKSAADGIYVGSSSVNFIGGGSLTADVSYNDRDGLYGREAWVFFEARTTVSLSGAHGINIVGMDTPTVSVYDDAKLYCFASQALNDKNYPALTCAYLNVRDNASVICETAFNGEAIDTWSNKFSNEEYDIKILKKGEYKSGTYGTVRSPYEPVLGINVSGGVYEDECRYISIKAKAVQSTYERGDINKDGYVDNKDVVLLFRFVSGSDQTVDESLCDFNEDGTVDNKDVVALFRYVSTK